MAAQQERQREGRGDGSDNGCYIAQISGNPALPNAATKAKNTDQ
jgi:hypothetical protein